MIWLRQHEPGVVVAGRAQVRERAQRVEAGEQRHRQPVAGRIEPDRRRAGQDADAVHRPDRIPVLDALDVVPHAVAVDEPRAGALGDGQHRPVDVRRNSRDHRGRGGARAAQASACARVRGCRRCRPTTTIVAPAVISNPPTTSREVAVATRGAGWREDVACGARHGAVGGQERRDPVAGEDRHAAAGLALLHGCLERRDDARARCPR